MAEMEKMPCPKLGRCSAKKCPLRKEKIPYILVGYDGTPCPRQFGVEKVAPGVVGRIVPPHMMGTREHQLIEQLIDDEKYTPDQAIAILTRCVSWIRGGADE